MFKRFYLVGLWTAGAVLVVGPGVPRLRASDLDRSPGPIVRKVEPPSWWAGHTLNPVRLLIRGTNLQGARVTSTRDGTVPGEPVVNARGTALFVDVAIAPAASPGAYPLRLETERGTATVPFRIEAPLDRSSHFQGINNDDILYLIMPDRFRDGDPSNNVPEGAPPEASDRRNPRAFHGGDLRGIIEALPYLKELGVTALWLNPWYDNANDLTACAQPWCPYTAYHGYHAIDFYGVDDHLGDLATLRELVETAHALGLKIIQDQVANHVGHEHPWVDDPPLDSWFHGTSAAHLRNPFRIDRLVSPHASEAERRATLDGWFTDELPDLNQDEPEVARYLIQNALWWVDVTGLDGLRLDTAVYVPRRFLRDLCQAVHRQHPRLWIVGEVLDLDPIDTSYYLGGRKGWDGLDTGLDSVFDFPLWAASANVFRGEGPASSLRSILRSDALYADPMRLTTLTGNHDLRRFLSMPGATTDGARLHLALTLSTRGTPQLLYGDEIAMAGGDDPDNRRDFPGGFAGDSRNAFEASGRTPEEQSMYLWTRAWIELRRQHPALRSGRLIDLFADDESYVFARRSEAETLVVAFHRAPVSRTLTLPVEPLGGGVSRLVPLGSAGPAITVDRRDATLKLDLPARSAMVFQGVDGAPRRKKSKKRAIHT